MADETPRHNVIIFVADGLRAGSVNPTDAPTMYQLEHQGVQFLNSHSLFPTVTTANASAIATGHGLGDTGDFANNLFVGFPVDSPDANGATLTPELEDDIVLRQLNGRWGGDYLPELSLLACARINGCQTAVIGKVGPALIQDVTQANTGQPRTIIVDDLTGSSRGVALPPGIAELFTNKSLPTRTPDRSNGNAKTNRLANGNHGDNLNPGTLAANVAQQNYFASVLTDVILPAFQAKTNGFVIVFWSRDPDGTQHNQGDSLNSLTNGINGPTSKAGVKNADNDLRKIWEALNKLGLATTTDVFVTADHGFDTISKHEVDASGTPTTSYAASFIYRGAKDYPEVQTNFLPYGFLAIDLANFLRTNFPGEPWPLFDSDRTEGAHYVQVDPANTATSSGVLQRPSNGKGLIGGTGQVKGPADFSVVITPSGGSDLIYVPNPRNSKLVPDIVDFLTRQDYVSGVFVDRRFGNVPGALSFTNIDLVGAAKTPRPAIIVNFRSFSFPADAADPLQHGVIVADTDLQEGQGNHGGFDRAATFNFMAACGPDFKTNYADPAPVSNRDIAPTLLQILKLHITPHGPLTGREIEEALAGQPDASTNLILHGTDTSSAAKNGLQTLLNWQEYQGRRYFDAAGFAGRTLGLRDSDGR